MKFKRVDYEFNIESVYSLEEMAKIGSYDNVDVIVFTNDPGYIPHFHIRDSNTNGTLFHTCIRIDSPEYFHHTGKEDILNSKDKKDLVRFLNQYSSSNRFKEFTNWQLLVTFWNMNNSNVQIDEDIEMPNYINLS